MILLEKLPVPVPLLVLLSLIVGLCTVLQHTPLAVTGEPPSDVILPPLTAVVVVIFATADVVKPGIFVVVKETSLPYPVPVLLMA